MKPVACPGCRSCYVQVWHAATAWRVYWGELTAHVVTLGLDRLTTGALS